MKPNECGLLHSRAQIHTSIHGREIEKPIPLCQCFAFGGLALICSACTAPSDAPIHRITFEDIAPSLGIAYERVPSKTFEAVENFRTESLTSPKVMPDMAGYPVKPRGAPGVAILDYDRDGDLDIYVTNGPGAANALLSNQLEETGDLDFVDVALAAAADATDQDSTGVCFGDTDNDGDQDLYVLGRDEPNILFENDGRGGFIDITASAGVDGGALGSASCAFGDTNGDGLLDLFVANALEFSSMVGILVEPFALNHPNLLFLNQGGNRFADVSAASGIRDLAGVPAETHDLTWAVTMVDYDQDGDTDIVTASDQGTVPPAAAGGVDRGFIRVFQNDGAGSFTDVTGRVGLLASPGAWMGLSIADLNHDGTLDIFGANIGNYMLGYTLDHLTSRHFLQDSDGSFTDTGAEPDLASVFGWGTAAFDYDNDGDPDIAYLGGMDLAFTIDSSNPGVVLKNDGSAEFTYDPEALAGPSSANHGRRIDQGLAVGDLNRDGFVDLISVSNQDAPDPLPLVTYQQFLEPPPFSSPFSPLAAFVPLFAETSAGSGEFVRDDIGTPNGSLAIDINSGGNDNQWASVELLGTAGITTDGRVNRDGIGAVVAFKPSGMPEALMPVLGGSSYASQNSLVLNFGLGKTSVGQLDVLWPGGVRNRLHDVRQSERIRFPEIPCSYADPALSLQDYESCLGRALGELLDAGVIDDGQKSRLQRSALMAFEETR